MKKLVLIVLFLFYFVTQGFLVLDEGFSSLTSAYNLRDRQLKSVVSD